MQYIIYNQTNKYKMMNKSLHGIIGYEKANNEKNLLFFALHPVFDDIRPRATVTAIILKYIINFLYTKTFY